MKTIKNYPRPQFVRDSWLSLNGKWKFVFDDENVGEEKQFFYKFPNFNEILVPFTYETKMSGINDETVHENIWYSNDININVEKDKNIILHFEGSDFVTKLWINGNYVGMNIGGYHRFSFDITKFIVDGKNNFTIKVEDSLSKVQPRGKQRYKKESFKCWYIQTTGIWKTIWIESVSKNHIVSVKNTPDYDNKNIEIELVTNISEKDITNFEIETEILFDNKIVNSKKQIIEDKILNYNVNIHSVENNDEINFWSPENPNLYDINYKLYYKGNIIDEVSSYFGIRKISIENSKIFLNNKELYLKMILDQGYWPDSHLTPPSEEAIIKDINIVKKYGYNGIRKHQKIEDERFLYYCDINGILVWSEMANCYEFNDKSIEYFMNEWIKVVKQNYNHPSIITWVPINESWGIPNVSVQKNEQNFANSLYYITKSIDKTRPVISNDGWEHTISDIITIHDYKQDPELLYNEYNDENLDVLNNRRAYNTIHKLFSENYVYSGQPIIMSEYGGITLNSDKGWVYGNPVKSEKEFLVRFEKLNDAIRKTKYICGYCYTQLTDVQQESNGLVYDDRNDKFSSETINKIASINGNKLMMKKMEYWNMHIYFNIIVKIKK